MKSLCQYVIEPEFHVERALMAVLPGGAYREDEQNGSACLFGTSRTFAATI